MNQALTLDWIRRLGNSVYAREWRRRPENIERLRLKKLISSAAYRAANPEKCKESVRLSKARARRDKRRAHVLEKSRHYSLKTNYGITAVQYDAMLLSQGGMCAICKDTCKTGRRLAVDHDHATGLIRGLLCAGCNRAIGAMKESISILESSIAYLRRYGKESN